MARQNKRPRPPRFLRLRTALIIFIVSFTAWAVFKGISAFVLNSPYFRVDKVIIVLIGRAPLSDRATRELLTIHRGRNIFEVDLKATSRFILSRYPEIKTALINKVFPNKLVLKIRPRRPAVQAGMFSGYYLLDGEGVVLPGVKNLAQPDLPVISGMDSRMLAANVGKKCVHDGLVKALRLICIMNQTGFAEGHEIHTIDVSDEKNLSFYIEGGIEILIGGEDFRNRLSVLEKTFNSGKADKAQIKYVDLRFGDAIIGPR